MKVLITGATGFVGQWTTKALLDRGHEVYAVSRVFSNGANEKVNWIVGNLDDLSFIENVLSDMSFDSLIHLAWEGLPNYSEENCLKNFKMTKELFELARRHLKGSVISTGSCWEYESRFGEQSEQSTLGTTGGSFLGVKNALRFLGESLCKEAGIAFYWMRLFFVYGPGQREGALMPSIFNALLSDRELPIRNPNNANDFIYVEDVAAAICEVMEKQPAACCFNVSSGKSVRVGDIVSLVKDVSEKVLDLTKINSSPIEASQDFWGSNERMKSELSWSPHFDLKKGISKTFQVYKEAH